MTEEKQTSETPEKKNPLREIVQPFIDLVHAPRALWGINLPYLFEGMCYFGVLGYLAIYFSDIVFAGIDHADVYSHYMVMVLTAGITIAMFFLGFVADKFGVRRALLAAFSVMLLGRLFIAGAPVAGLENGLWGGVHIATLVGIFFVVIGYGMYQPAAYAAVRQFTNPKSAAMGFAMLYALMNLGGYLPSFAFLVREDKYLGWGLDGGFWVYTGFTFISLVLTILILTRKTVAAAISRAKGERGAKPEEKKDDKPKKRILDETKPVPTHLWVFILVVEALFLLIPFDWLRYGLWGASALAAVVILLLPGAKRRKVLAWIASHPLSDAKFFFFIFALIPVQTLFAYNWLILPQYVSRCYEGWIGEKFELAANFNPLLIFIFVPIVTALTYKKRVYNMMIIGTFVMAVPAFFLALGTNFWALFSYLVIMTIGEAMWQPRFLQFAAQIAPEGRTGEYMGVAQLPWFLTKMLVPALYSGLMLERFCPVDGFRDPQTMWFWFACIAIASPILLVIFKGWAGKDFQERAS